MEVRPISGLQELQQHLAELSESPETPTHTKTFDDVELQLTDENIPPLVPQLLPRLIQILSTYKNDPKQLVSLSIKLLRPVQFTEILALADEESLVRALQSPAPSANILALTVLHKAAKRPSDTAILSGMESVVTQFLRTWLGSPDVGVGERATNALADLLEVDCERKLSDGLDTQMSGLEIASRSPPGQGLLWRRIFGDQQIYSLLFTLCSNNTAGPPPDQLSLHQKTLAQARLLRILPRLAVLEFPILMRSEFPNVDARFGLRDGRQGLLVFAGTKMIDKEDVLMKLTLMDFFAKLLEAMSMVEIGRSTMQSLVALVRLTTREDAAMYKSLESLAMSPNSSEELVELLVKLEEHP